MNDDTEKIRAEGKKVLQRRRMLRELHKSDIIAPRSAMIEHYHLVFSEAKTDTVLADYEQRFDSQKAAFLALKALGDRAEPNTEWYEDGQIGFETRLHGQMGLHWIIAAVGMCHRQNCVREKPVLEILTR